MTIPVLPILSVSIDSVVGNTFIIRGSVTGTNSLFSGVLQLFSADSIDGPWSFIGTFSGSILKLQTKIKSDPGKFVRGSLEGVAELLDTKSPPIQLLAKPKVVCKLPPSGRIGQKLKGICTSDVELKNTLVFLQSNTGNGWANLGSGNVSGSTIPLNVTGQKVGILQVRVFSKGLLGLYAPFTSFVSKISIIGKK
jgi:hypothetical protein